MMRKIISLFMTMFIGGAFLIGCGSTPEKKEQSKPTAKVEEKKGPTQEEINDKLKKEAVKADFKKLNGHEKENKNLKVFIKGKVTVVDKTKKIEMFNCFTINEESGDGIYTILNILDLPVTEGDTVTVYGSVEENKSKYGGPLITSTLIEK